VKTPERTTAAAFPRHPSVHIIGDSAALKWSGIFIRRHRYPRVVDRFLVPAPEPLITCTIAGRAEFRERDVGGAWLTHHIPRGDIFVTRSRVPYEVRFTSPAGKEIDVISVLSALKAEYAPARHPHRRR
jgi:AraC family transcriptional regulator